MRVKRGEKRAIVLSLNYLLSLMSRLAMKKLIAFVTALVYVSLSNYCLTYAIVTGESHPYPGLISSSDRHSSHEHGVLHSHDQGHQHGDTHNHNHDHDHGAGGDSSSHHGSDKSDTCCSTFSRDVPQLLPSPPAPPKPTLATDFALAVVADATITVEKREILYRNHGPPGPFSQDIHLSLLSPRAPPSSESL